MGLLDRWARRRGYVPATEAQALATQAAGRAYKGALMRRSFAAAKVDSTVESWLTSNATLNQDLFRYLRKVRERCRDVAVNNDYGVNFLRRVRTQVVGPAGVQCVPKPLRPDGTVDQLDAKALADAFWLWGKRGNCEVTGKLSWVDVQNLAIKLIARDGECLVRRVRGRKFGPHWYQLQFIAIDVLDEDYNADLQNGNRIRMSVEFDGFNRPVAYWLRTDNPLDVTGYGVSYSQRRERVPAADLLHLFVPEDADQIRGIPWMHAGLLRMHQLGDFDEYAVIAAKVGASKGGFFTSEQDEDAGDAAQRIAQSVEGTATQGYEFATEATPNHFDVLPKGIDFKPYNPDYPHQHYGEFVKACLRGISSGLGVNYNAWANDYESVNYSSARAGLLDEREIWKSLQTWLIESLHDIVFTEWLEYAIGSGALALPMSRFDNFNSATWRPRRWAWVDPLKDAQASETEVALGINSRRRIILERGDDPDEIWAELKQEESLGFEINLTPAPIGNSGGDTQQATQGEKSDPRRRRRGKRGGRRGKQMTQTHAAEN